MKEDKNNTKLIKAINAYNNYCLAYTGGEAIDLSTVQATAGCCFPLDTFYESDDNKHIDVYYCFDTCILLFRYIDTEHNVVESHDEALSIKEFASFSADCLNNYIFYKSMYLFSIYKSDNKKHSGRYPWGDEESSGSLATRVIHSRHQLSDTKELINTLGNVLYGMDYTDDMNPTVIDTDSLNEEVTVINNDIKEINQVLTKILNKLNDYEPLEKDEGDCDAR